MKIHKLILENFRAYRAPTEIAFDDLTVIIGKNDVGKSTILEGLDIFFGNRKLDEHDLNIQAAEEKGGIKISVEFSELPKTIDLDAGAITNLEEEYLTKDNKLRILKDFSSLTRPKTFIIAHHPSNELANDLHSLKITELRARADQLDIPRDYNRNVKNEIRKAIWRHFPESLTFEDRAIEISQEGVKDIWDKLSPQLPLFALFQSDRSNQDKDSEIQDPMKLATKEVLKTLSSQLEAIRKEVHDSVTEIARRTIAKVQDMNQEVASSLVPEIPEPNWEKVFNITLKSDGIPLNKRGSGVRRLVLINFFREEAERKRNEKNAPNVIYGIEEPETSQHPDWQVKLIEALRELSEAEKSQVILTTHSPALASMVELENIRFVYTSDSGNQIEIGSEDNFQTIAETLGVLPVLPDKLDEVKVIVCLEGPTDVQFFKHIGPHFSLDIENDPRVVIIHMGGDTLGQWVTNDYLKKLNRPEVHIYDSDVEKYKASIEEVNNRGNNCWAVQTQMYEIENYIHPTLIKGLYRIDRDFIDTSRENWQESWKGQDVPKSLKQFLQELKENGYGYLINYSQQKIKKKLTDEGARAMTMELIHDLGCYDEMKSWFDAIMSRIS